jgi:hypothetical protein
MTFPIQPCALAASVVFSEAGNLSVPGFAVPTTGLVKNAFVSILLPDRVRPLAARSARSTDLGVGNQCQSAPLLPVLHSANCVWRG